MVASVQAQRLIRMFCGDSRTRIPCFIRSSLLDQRWQIAGTARFRVGFCMISSVSTDTASAVSLNGTPPQPLELYVDETGEITAPLRGTLFDLGGSSASGQTRSIGLHWRLQSHGHPEFRQPV